MVATTLKAILGAVDLDGGLEAMALVMAKLGLDHKLLDVSSSFFLSFLPRAQTYERSAINRAP